MSRNIPLQVIQRLQSNPKCIRNICILAHVDHGKTTLADGLISSNGIISTRLAGEIRYMDNLEEEQKRGITMKSSSISLFFEDEVLTTDEKNEEKVKKSLPYLINLVDSPGHIDFSSDVSAAVRLCDGCLIVVDAIEGVCTQTLTVLHQAFQEGVKPILIINKIDRLILHLKQTPMDAYTHIRNIIEKINAYISNLYTAEVISNTATTSYIIDSEKEEQLFVSPVNGTVLFASAVHGWCFSLRQFADLYSPILGISRSKLLPYMWGDYVYNSKNKTVSTWTPSSSNPPIFVKMVLSEIWKMYKNVYKRNEENLMKMFDIIHISVSKRELSGVDPNVLIKSIMGKWLPLYKAVLKSVVRVLPSPIAAQPLRYDYLWDGATRKKIRDEEEKGDSCSLMQFRSAFMSCDPSSDVVMVYICKLFSVLPVDMQGYAPEEAEEEYELALCRIFSGTITKRSRIYIISSNANGAGRLVETPIELFLLMGREVIHVDEVKSGNIFGLLGVGHTVIKTSTISNKENCPSLASLRLPSDPIVQVAVETEKPSDMPLLLKELSVLNNSDNSIFIKATKTGEYIISAVGELQLEVIIHDLQKRLKETKLIVSPPIINVKEGCAYCTTEGGKQQDPAYVELFNKLYFKMRVLPLPSSMADLLYKFSKSHCDLYRSIMEMIPPTGEQKVFLESLHQAFTSSSLSAFFPSLLSFGMNNMDTNILALGPQFTAYDGTAFPFARKWHLYYSTFIYPEDNPEEVEIRPNDDILQEGEIRHLLLQQYQSCIVNGFKMACECGPLCGEEMWGVLFVLEDFYFLPGPTTPQEEVEDMHTQLAEWRGVALSYEEVNERIQTINAGSVMTSMRQLCHQAYQKASPRIIEPIYKCILQCSQDQLGKLYSVLNQRRGEIQNEDIWEGTEIFSITCMLPVTESLGLANDLRQQTSGAVNQPQLQFSHWQLLDEDPFSKPTTEEEKEEWGNSFAGKNKAWQIVDKIRMRKGMQREEKIVANAEKQKTLKSK